MLKKIEEYLEDYNSTSKTQMKLILFLDACDHVARICRVLRQPLGNALLLGVGGSGRQSLARLATFISQYKQF
jgi:dynein heavy chain